MAEQAVPKNAKIIFLNFGNPGLHLRSFLIINSFAQLWVERT